MQKTKYQKARKALTLALAAISIAYFVPMMMASQHKAYAFSDNELAAFTNGQNQGGSDAMYDYMFNTIGQRVAPGHPDGCLGDDSEEDLQCDYDEGEMETYYYAMCHWYNIQDYCI